MRRKTYLSVLLIFVFFATNAKAQSICSLLEHVSRMEAASNEFISSRTDSQRGYALAKMSKELSIVVDQSNLESSKFDETRNALSAFVQSRQQMLHRAENFGISAALAMARTSSYVQRKETFDLLYRPLRCSAPAKPLTPNDIEDSLETETDIPEMSVQSDITLSSSMMAYIALAVAIISGAGFRCIETVKLLRKRRSKRFNCLVDIAICQDGFRYDASLHDLSQVGCKIKSHSNFAIGERIEVMLAGAERSGTIIWTNRHYTGVEFDKELSEAQVLVAIEAQNSGRQSAMLGKLGKGVQLHHRSPFMPVERID